MRLSPQAVDLNSLGDRPTAHRESTVQTHTHEFPLNACTVIAQKHTNLNFFNRAKVFPNGCPHFPLLEIPSSKRANRPLLIRLQSTEFQTLAAAECMNWKCPLQSSGKAETGQAGLFRVTSPTEFQKTTRKAKTCSSRLTFQRR